MAEIDVVKSRSNRDPEIEMTGFRLSWGAIFAGLVVATVLQIVLSTLGVAIGLAAFDPGQGDSASNFGIGALVWAALTAIVTLFIGGMTTGRLAGILTRGDGMIHGVVMWGLSTLLAVWMISSGAGALLGGAFNLLGRTAAATAGGVASSVGQIGAAAVNQAGNANINFDAIQREIETTLNQTGNPALAPESLRADAQQVGAQTTQGSASNAQVAREVGDLLRSRAGQVDREEIINVVVARTGRDRAEAERIADRVQSATTNAQAQISQTANDVQARAGELAADASNTLARAAWGALLLMGLSVAAAAFGAATTARE